MLPSVEQEVREIGAVDLVVGVPTYNNARTIGPLLEALRLGLAKHFPGVRAALVTTDAGSTDETRQLAARAEWDGPRLLMQHEAPAGERVGVPYHGIPGRGAAHRAILETARGLEAKACGWVGADVVGVAPDWVDRLFRPVLEDGFDYVASRYQRHRYEGTLTLGVIAPLVRAVYGRRIRQPMAGQAGLSGRFVAHLCAQDIWAGEPSRHGVDLWLTVLAVSEGLAICESWLGPYATDADGRTTDLATTFAQAVGVTFAVLDRTADVWEGIRKSEAVPLVGTPVAVGIEPTDVNIPRMLQAFRLGVKDLLPLWEQVLGAETLADVLAIAATPDEAFHFPHDVWARVVYDFALAYHFRVLYREHLLRSLVPLYLGRTGAFIRLTAPAGAAETEAWSEAAGRAFEAGKPYLAERWQ